MRIPSTGPLAAAAGLALAIGAGVALARGSAAPTEIAWLPTLTDGQKAAARAGRPILLVTAWKPGT